MRRARLVLAALALAGAVAACSGGDDGGSEASGNDIPGVEVIVVPPYKHTNARVDYDRHPPVGGDHGATSAPCGFYDEELPDEFSVHTLEHGGVWLAYSPTLSAEDVAVLRNVVATEDDTFATPYPDLDPGVAVVVSAWGRQLKVESVADPRIVQFIEAFRNADTAPEARIRCPQLDAG